jgi:hypothetical protein
MATLDISVAHHHCEALTRRWVAEPEDEELDLVLVGLPVLLFDLETERGEPVAGVRIIAWPTGEHRYSSALSNVNGHAALEVPRGRAFMVSLKSADFVPETLPLTVTVFPSAHSVVLRRGHPLRIVLERSTWERCSHWLEVQVRGHEGAAVFGCTVADVLAEADGSATVGYLREGTYTVTVAHRGTRLIANRQLTLPGPPLLVPGPLPDGVLRVVNEGGLPLRNAMVLAQSGATGAMSVTDTEGVACIRFRGPTWVLVSHPRHASGLVRLDLADGVVSTVTLEPRPQGSVTVRASDGLGPGEPYTGWVRVGADGKRSVLEGRLNETEHTLPCGEAEYELQVAELAYRGSIEVVAPTCALHLGEGDVVMSVRVRRESSLREQVVFVNSGEQGEGVWTEARLLPGVGEVAIGVTGLRHAVYGFRDGRRVLIAQVSTLEDAVVRIPDDLDGAAPPAKVLVLGAEPGGSIRFWGKGVQGGRVDADALGSAEMSFDIKSRVSLSVKSRQFIRSTVVAPGDILTLDVGASGSPTISLEAPGVQGIAVCKWVDGQVLTEELQFEGSEWSGRTIQPPCLAIVDVTPQRRLLLMVQASGRCALQCSDNLVLKQDGSRFSGRLHAYWPPEAPKRLRLLYGVALVHDGKSVDASFVLARSLQLYVEASPLDGPTYRGIATVDAHGSVRFGR